METRFGVKDFFLFLLLTALIVIVVLAMVQYDRQWGEIEKIRAELSDQRRDLRDVHDAITRGLTLASGQGSATSAPTTDAAANDPFYDIRAAQQMPGYSRGDWFIDSFGNNVAKLTPLVSSDAYASDVQDFVLESLVIRDPNTLDWVPFLSTSWTVEDHMREYRDAVAKEKAAGKTDDQISKEATVPPPIVVKFKMRPGLNFSDGEPLTADDVAWTFDFIMDPKIAAPRDRAYLEKIRSVRKTGPDEVTFTFNEPYYDPIELAGGMSVLPKHFYSQFKPEEFNQSVGLLMGSGPYRLDDPKSWKPGESSIQVVRNERYWGVQPAFDRIVWRLYTNDVAHLTAFRNGDVDLFGAAPDQYRKMLQDQPLVDRTQHFEYFSPRGGYRFIAWNQKKPDGSPSRFADKRVRQAMTMLVDRQRMMEQIALGYALLATGPFSPVSKQYNHDVKPWPFDTAAATKLLADAGYTTRNDQGLLVGPDGQPFRFKLTYPSGSGNYERMILFLKDSYARAGIELDPDPLEWAVFTDKLNNKNFDAISLGWTAGVETDIYQMFDSSQMVAGGDDFMSYKNPELDRNIEEARQTLDAPKRMELWRKCHAILHEDQPYMFLWFGKSLVFLDKRIRDVKETKLGLSPRNTWFVPRDQQKWEK